MREMRDFDLLRECRRRSSTKFFSVAAMLICTNSRPDAGGAGRMTEGNPPVMPPSQETARFLQKGTFALQCHDPGSKTRFRNLRYRPLPADLPKLPAPAVDAGFKQVIDLGVKNYPLIDFHVHLPTPGWLDMSMRGYVEAAERYFRSKVARKSLDEAHKLAMIFNMTDIMEVGFLALEKLLDSRKHQVADKFKDKNLVQLAL